MNIAPAIDAANGLTGRWCAEAGDDNFVLSGAGLWPLLALLASAAAGSTRDELAAAAGTVSQHDALEVLEALQRADAASAALGLWVRDGLPLNDAWVRGLPAGIIERLSGQAALDAWASQHTMGLIERFPLTVTPDDVLVLATALAAKTLWRHKFSPSGSMLYRTSSDLGIAGIVDGVTRVIVEGRDDVDVHLVVGDGGPGPVIAAGLAALSGSAVQPASELPVGSTAPGLVVAEERASSSDDQLRLVLPPFDIHSSHDLLQHADLFGLRSATTSSAQFPGLSPDDLVLSSGTQAVLATFSAEGFEAAAVTAFGFARASAPLFRHRARVVRITFDRPFGFIAVHRPSGLAIVAGWVAKPA